MSIPSHGTFQLATSAWFAWYCLNGKMPTDRNNCIRRPIVGWITETNPAGSIIDIYAMVLSIGERNTSLTKATEYHITDYFLVGVEWPGMTNTELNTLLYNWPMLPLPHAGR